MQETIAPSCGADLPAGGGVRGVPADAGGAPCVRRRTSLALWVPLTFRGRQRRGGIGAVGLGSISESTLVESIVKTAPSA